MNKEIDDIKLLEAIKALEDAMKYSDKAKEDEFYFSGISKSFEVCLEYAWKYLKRKAIEEGLEVYSPKDAVKMAGKMKIIDNVERWIDFIDSRNLAVHDYLDISDKDYMKTIRDFLVEVRRMAPQGGK